MRRLVKGIIASTSALVLGASSWSLTAEPASAAIISNTFISQEKGTCIDTNGSGVYASPCYFNRPQGWEPSLVFQGAQVTFRNVEHRSRCLDSNAAGAVYAESCNGGNYQKWYIEDRGGNNRSLKNVATGRCLDIGQNRPSTTPCNGGNRYQTFQLFSSSF